MECMHSIVDGTSILTEYQFCNNNMLCLLGYLNEVGRFFFLTARAGLESLTCMKDLDLVYYDRIHNTRFVKKLKEVKPANN